MSTFSHRSRCCGKGNRGFSILELLTVLLIIGTLATVVFASVSSSQMRARDAKRLAALETIHDAVEQYRADNGHYPITNCQGNIYNTVSYDDAPYAGGHTCAAPGGVGTQTLAQTLASYIPAPIIDPLQDSIHDKGYLFLSPTGVDYCILLWNTPENLNNFAPSYVDPARCGGVGSNGQCNAPGSMGAANNAVYYGTGAYAGGC